MLPLLTGCGGGSAAEAAGEPAAVTEEIAGSDVVRIKLSAKAAQRLDIQTAPVVRNGGRLEIPYSAVYYAPTGETWAYVSPSPLTFVREQIVVANIEGDRAILSSGPAVGTKVATVGASELFGVESGLGQ